MWFNRKTLYTLFLFIKCFQSTYYPQTLGVQQCDPTFKRVLKSIQVQAVNQNKEFRDRDTVGGRVSI